MQSILYEKEPYFICQATKTLSRVTEKLSCACVARLAHQLSPARRRAPQLASRGEPACATTPLSRFGLCVAAKKLAAESRRGRAFVLEQLLFLPRFLLKRTSSRTACASSAGGPAALLLLLRADRKARRKKDIASYVGQMAAVRNRPCIYAIISKSQHGNWKSVRVLLLGGDGRTRPAPPVHCRSEASVLWTDLITRHDVLSKGIWISHHHPACSSLSLSPSSSSLA